MFDTLHTYLTQARLTMLNRLPTQPQLVAALNKHRLLVELFFTAVGTNFSLLSTETDLKIRRVMWDFHNVYTHICAPKMSLDPFYFSSHKTHR